MKTGLRWISALLLSVLFVLCTGTNGVWAEETPVLTVSYTFEGDRAEKAGYAQGKIVITPNEGAKSAGYYLLYYADDTDTLKGYDELAALNITGKTRSFTVKSGIMLPEGATRIAVFESDVRVLEEAPSISEAAGVAEIPASKRFVPLTPTFSFAAVSDVHMNYEAHARGAYQKWADALRFFSEAGMEYIIVTGDMTGDQSGSENLVADYETYVRIIEESPFPKEKIYESLGNHGNTPSVIEFFTQYTSGEGEQHPYENSPYYSVLIEGKDDSARDTLFIFLWQELKAPGDSAAYDNFSEAQIDWLEGLLKQYGETDTNIFLIEHAPFLNYGPGDRHPGGYGALVTFKAEYAQSMRLKGLLETYRDVVVMSGHTHLTLYDNENYSNERGKSCHMVHVGSTSQPCGYGEGTEFVRSSDGRQGVTETYGSEGYLVTVYPNAIVYTGYNLSTKKIIPAACLIIPRAYEPPAEEAESEVTTVVVCSAEAPGGGKGKLALAIAIPAVAVTVAVVAIVIVKKRKQ